jgi:Flp pilus assembly pilin Flp
VSFTKRRREDPNNEGGQLFGSIQKLRAFVRNDGGQALVEYSLVLLLVALAAVSILTTLGVSVTSSLTTVANAL